jgi:predicted nucleic-acid-binding protein
VGGSYAGGAEETHMIHMSRTNSSVIDANLLVRFKTKDVPEQAEKARLLFQHVIEGNLSIAVPEVVIAEVVYVLSSPRLYNLSREEIAEYLTDLLKLKGVVISYRALCTEALAIYAEHPIDFVDAYRAAMVALGHAKELVTFDKRLSKLGIRQREP